MISNRLKKLSESATLEMARKSRELKAKGVDVISLSLGEPDFNTPEKKDIHVIKAARIKGSITIFPSFVWHRVKPVTSGTRYSLVNWHQGRPFS